MSGVRTAKYAVKAAYLLVWAFTLLIVAGPILGATTPQVMAQQPLGLGIDLPSLQSQFNSSSLVVGNHFFHVPAFNNWPIAGSASLTLTLVVKGQTLYQTAPATIQLAPFQAGTLDISMGVSQALASQLQGQTVAVGGSMSLSEGQFWKITVNLSQ